jgi:hypothetical protein
MELIKLSDPTLNICKFEKEAESVAETIDNILNNLVIIIYFTLLLY